MSQDHDEKRPGSQASVHPADKEDRDSFVALQNQLQKDDSQRNTNSVMIVQETNAEPRFAGADVDKREHGADLPPAV